MTTSKAVTTTSAEPFTYPRKSSETGLPHTKQTVLIQSTYDFLQYDRDGLFISTEFSYVAPFWCKEMLISSLLRYRRGVDDHTHLLFNPHVRYCLPLPELALCTENVVNGIANRMGFPNTFRAVAVTGFLSYKDSTPALSPPTQLLYLSIPGMWKTHALLAHLLFSLIRCSQAISSYNSANPLSKILRVEDISTKLYRAKPRYSHQTEDIRSLIKVVRNAELHTLITRNYQNVLPAAERDQCTYGLSTFSQAFAVPKPLTVGE